jgi:hypothetical protein
MPRKAGTMFGKVQTDNFRRCGDREASRGFWRKGLTRAAAVTALAATLAVGGGIAASQPAEAASAYCGGGRCTLYLSKGETRSLGYGAVPAPPGSTPWQLRAAYYGLAYGHRWFAQQYANRGMCSGFRLSIYPWESQGYFGYYC